MVWLPEKEKERERVRSEGRENYTTLMKKATKSLSTYLQNNLNSVSLKSFIHLHRKRMATILDHNLVKYLAQEGINLQMSLN